MKKRTIIVLSVLVVIAAAVLYAYREYHRKNADLAHAGADISLPATELVREFETSDSAATEKFNGRIIEIDGVVRNVEVDERGYRTVIIGDSSSISSVRCSLDTLHQQEAIHLSRGATATIRGACAGFNKDEMGLGSDVILNRCVVIAPKNNTDNP